MPALARLHVVSGLPSAALLGRVAVLVSATLRALRNRREVSRLGELSDRELADIGLTRIDLAAVSRLPLAVDPTRHLAPLVEARARAEERAARSVC